MSKEYISIQEASDLTKKSIQTIRRAIKAKKFAAKRQSTPQGFNYLVEEDSLCAFYGVNSGTNVGTETAKEEKVSEVKAPSKGFHVSEDDFRNFTKTLEKMITQHSDERQNFLRLVNTLQEKIFVLENQVNLLKAPQKKWYQLWK